MNTTDVDLTCVGLPPKSRINQIRRKWMYDRLTQDADDLRRFGLNELADALDHAAAEIYEGRVTERRTRSRT